MHLNPSDWINGIFESIGGIFLWYNVWRLSCDKKVKGVSVGSTAFFTLWSWWNLYFYPHNDLWLSFLGGLLIVSANTAWVALAFRYYLRDKRNEALEDKGLTMMFTQRDREIRAEMLAETKEIVSITSSTYQTGDIWNFVVNGRVHCVSNGHITFEELARLEYPDIEPSKLRISVSGVRPRPNDHDRLMEMETYHADLRPGSVVLLLSEKEKQTGYTQIFHVTASTPGIVYS